MGSLHYKANEKTRQARLCLPVLKKCMGHLLKASGARDMEAILGNGKKCHKIHYSK
jgi:hypothetical protein